MMRVVRWTPVDLGHQRDITVGWGSPMSRIWAHLGRLRRVAVAPRLPGQSRRSHAELRVTSIACDPDAVKLPQPLRDRADRSHQTSQPPHRLSFSSPPTDDRESIMRGGRWCSNSRTDSVGSCRLVGGGYVRPHATTHRIALIDRRSIRRSRDNY